MKNSKGESEGWMGGLVLWMLEKAKGRCSRFIVRYRSHMLVRSFFFFSPPGLS